MNGAWGYAVSFHFPNRFPMKFNWILHLMLDQFCKQISIYFRHFLFDVLSIVDPFWSDFHFIFHSIFDRILIDFGSIFISFFIEFSVIFNWFCTRSENRKKKRSTKFFIVAPCKFLGDHCVFFGDHSNFHPHPKTYVPKITR